jgi:predicted negative regulator of RcsB-dependent stress response
MATQHLDLDEQEQLDQIKQFWAKFGNIITWALIAVLSAYAAWLGYNTWQSKQAANASAIYEQLDKAARTADIATVKTALTDMNASYAKTSYADQANLVAAKVYQDKAMPEEAKAALQNVIDNAKDDSYVAMARLRLASVLADQKNYDAALKTLEFKVPEAFEGLVSDRLGDIYQLNNKAAEAKAAYETAYKKLPETAVYRRIVEVKLRSLGVEPPAVASQAASAAQP